MDSNVVKCSNLECSVSVLVICVANFLCTATCMFSLVLNINLIYCPYIFRSMLLSTCLDEFCHFPIAYPVALTSVTCRGCGQTHSVESFTAKTPLNHIPTKLQNLIKSILLENQAPKRSAETVSSSNSTIMLSFSFC